MAFAGLKKQINKANQYVTEKMGGAEGTKLDLDFVEMERKTDVTVELVEEVQVKTKEYLQPNPTARAKMAAVKGISKLSGQAKSNTYPQPEGILADCMLLYGRKLGEDSIFAQAMIEMGESLKQMADVKYSLDDNIKQNFLEPMHHLQTKDLKEVMHHRKKLQGRRLDFDCKRRRQAKGSHITDDEIRSAEDKFAESLHLAQVGMYHLLENDVEQVSQLVTFAEAMLDFHQQSTEILKILVETLAQKKEDAINRPKPEFVPKTLNDLNIEGLSSTENGGRYLNHNDNNISRIKNSHHQHFSSQQNLSVNNNNNNNNNNMNSSNFQRNKIYGSQQSLSTISNRSSNNSISYSNNNNSQNKQQQKMSSLSSTSTSTTTTSSSNNRNSIDWLNAWNNPPPQPPQPQFKKPQQQQQTHYKMLTSQTTTTIPQTNSHNNYKRTTSSSSFNDPWSVNKPTHLELTDNGHGQARSTNASPLPSPMRSPARTPMPRPSGGPCCSALYDFEPENPGELGFKENDVIQLINRVDENWYEGSVNGRTGYFPQSYVQIMVPLPN